MKLIGSANEVTYISDIARLTMNTLSTFRIIRLVHTRISVTMLPNVPTTVATTRIISVGRAVAGLDEINSCRPNFPLLSAALEPLPKS